jgi:hypothetical protein
MKMSFKMPVCYESQQMATLIEAIFVINELSGHCGHRELQTDRPRHEEPYTVCTVHFPENVVVFDEQHEWRLQGPDGMIFLYGTGVSNRRKANFEKAQARKAEEEAYRAANPTPHPSSTPRYWPGPVQPPWLSGRPWWCQSKLQKAVRSSQNLSLRLPEPSARAHSWRRTPTS